MMVEKEHAGLRPVARPFSHPLQRALVGAQASTKILIPALVLAIGLLAARPFLVPRLTLTFDSSFHYYALVQLDHLFAQGILYPRWFPYRIGGFGSPFFQYYSPLAYYAAQIFNLLGLETLASLRLAWALMLVTGTLGIYLWVRDLLGRGAGLVAAAAYACGPYMLFNAFYRGGFTEQCALMLMPFALWALSRLAATGQARYLALGALAYGSIIPAHSLTAMLFTPLLAVYAVLLAWGRARSGQRRRALGLQWAAMGLGLGLAAFFWLPFLAERNAFHNELAFGGSSALDYHRHFISLEELLFPPFRTTLLPGMSLVAVALAATGLLWISWRGVRLQAGEEISSGMVLESSLVWFAALVTGVCAIMTLPLSVGIWEAIPPLRYFQFTHRFLTVGVVFLAFLAGAGARVLRQRLTPAGWSPLARRALGIGVLLAATALLTSHAWKLSRWVQYFGPLPEIDVTFIMEKEQLGGPAEGEVPTMFIPATVREMPPREELAQNGPERLDLASLPAGAEVLAAHYGPLRYELALSSPAPFVARFRTFHFPGWWAELDGQPAPIMPTDPHGQISVEVPAGEHRLVIRFGSTPVRTFATAASVATAAVLGLVLYGLWIQERRPDWGNPQGLNGRVTFLPRGLSSPPIENPLSQEEES